MVRQQVQEAISAHRSRRMRQKFGAEAVLQSAAVDASGRHTLFGTNQPEQCVAEAGADMHSAELDQRPRVQAQGVRESDSLLEGH